MKDERERDAIRDRREEARGRKKKKERKGKGREGKEEEEGKTHRPIVPAGWQPKSRPLIRRSNIREALGCLVGWLAGGKEVAGTRRTPNQSEVRERYEKKGGSEGVGGATGEANDTSLGNFNFAEITVGLIRIKRSW